VPHIDPCCCSSFNQSRNSSKVELRQILRGLLLLLLLLLLLDPGWCVCLLAGNMPWLLLLLLLWPWFTEQVLDGTEQPMEAADGCCPSRSLTCCCCCC
jgi:hypothetical protein